MISPHHKNEGNRGSNALDSSFLWESVALDVNLTSVQIATIAMLLNACVARNADWTLRAWRHILPDSGNVMQLTLCYAGEAGLPQALTGAIGQLYKDVARAKSDLAPLIISASVYNATERRLLAFACPCWRKLARDAAQAIAGIAANRSLAPIIQKDCATLTVLLREAMNGESQRVRPNGEIELPPNEQRRRSARLSVSVSCQVMLPGRTLPGVLQDVSREGAQVECAYPLAAGQSIVLAFPNGRQLPAVVIRWSGSRAGLRLLNPLAANDPLFSAGHDAGGSRH
jgi:hypothetical protein